VADFLGQRRAVLGSVVLAAGLAVAKPSAAADAPPAVSPEGLKLVPGSKATVLYLREGADFSGYSKVAILECLVSFKKNYKRDHSSPGSAFRVTDDDMNRMKTEMAALFKQVFTQELSSHGQAVVTGTGDSVLTLRPAIINLDVQAPNTVSPGQKTWSASAGQATLLLEAYDSVSSELLARVYDVQVLGDTATISQRNGATNRSDANRVMKKWAQQLATYLQQAREGAKASTPPAK
jgi:hypothetical protein